MFVLESYDAVRFFPWLYNFIHICSSPTSVSSGWSPSCDRVTAALVSQTVGERILSQKI